MPTDDLDDELLDDAAEMPDDIDEEDLEELEDEEDLEEPLDDEDLEKDEDVADNIDESAEVEAKAPREDEEEEEEDEDDDGDEVEASLDVILKERLVVADDDVEEDEEEEPGEADERGEGPLRVLPKQPGEFVCQSCFLVKHPSQLADGKRMYCRDCV